MTAKYQDRLIVALDVPTIKDAETIVNRLDDSVTFYKVGFELIMRGGISFLPELLKRNKKIFLDVKLLDISNTVERAVANAAELGVNFINLHGHDRKTVRAAVAGRGSSPMKLLAVTVLTNLTRDDLIEQGITGMEPGELVQRRAQMAVETGCDGIISSGQEAARLRKQLGAKPLIVTPGIRPADTSRDDQKRVTTPTDAILAGADYLVVGRPVIQADDPPQVANAIVREIEQAMAKRTDT